MVGGGLAGDVARLTRAAFADADPLPGLPPPDGAAESAAAVAADVAAGARLWTARDADGSLLGSVRALVPEPGTWQVRRLAVLPAALGRGVARRLVRALEAGAAAAGARRVALDAVVERGNPPVYARLGYRTVHYLPNPDKPLSEVHMERRLSAGPAAQPHPRPTGTLPEGVPLADWFGVDGGLLAVLGRVGGDDEFAGLPRRRAVAKRFAGGGAVRHAGTDAWCGGPRTPERWRGLLAAHADAVHGDLLVFGRPAAEVAPYLMPRRVAPGALALCRCYAAPR